MGQASPSKPIALVVEDDEMQREMVAMLLEESEMGVIQCENAEQAFQVLKKNGASLSMMFTDIQLSGQVDGVELAHFTHQHYPNIHLIVTSGFVLVKRLPDGTTFMSKPWTPLDLLREAARLQH